VNFGAVACMSINRPFCGRTCRSAAEDVLAVQELRPVMVHRPNRQIPFQGQASFLKCSCIGVVYLATDAMPS
jgi:hypothetical protein